MKTVSAVLEGEINDNAWVNDTWLSPYTGYKCTLKVEGAKKTLYLDDSEHDVSGTFTAPNGWNYQIEKLIS